MELTYLSTEQLSPKVQLACAKHYENFLPYHKRVCHKLTGFLKSLRHLGCESLNSASSTGGLKEFLVNVNSTTI